MQAFLAVLEAEQPGLSQGTIEDLEWDLKAANCVWFNDAEKLFQNIQGSTTKRHSWAVLVPAGRAGALELVRPEMDEQRYRIDVESTGLSPAQDEHTPQNLLSWEQGDRTKFRIFDASSAGHLEFAVEHLQTDPAPTVTLRAWSVAETC